MTHADPNLLAACHLDDFAEAWASRLRIPVTTLARGDAEPDADYRPRLLRLIAERRSK